MFRFGLDLVLEMFKRQVLFSLTGDKVFKEACTLKIMFVFFLRTRNFGWRHVMIPEIARKGKGGFLDMPEDCP